jgi:hypothetical protein
MAVGSKSYLDLVREAVDGTLQLPAFQRDWAWKPRQTAALFDSIRLQYPIGGFLFTESSQELDLQPKTFRFSSPHAQQKKPSLLVLDGQQRITAGIQLFFSSTQTAGDTLHFFIDLEAVRKSFEATQGDMENEDDVAAYAAQLDPDTKYIKALKATNNPVSYLVDKHLLFTSLLRPDREKQLDVAIDQYLSAYPTQKQFIRNLVKPLFKISNTPIVPFISLGSDLRVEAISRIFSTLNRTGKLLTPFELVVAILYPKDIDLRDEIKRGREQFPLHYPQMDKSGEIALQVAVLISNRDPKKASLPKTLTKDIWTSHGPESFKYLDLVGDFLTKRLGFALDKTAAYIPYDSLFAPLAVIWRKAKLDTLPVPVRNKAQQKMLRWVVGSVLSSRYQEGVHNKQKSDAETVGEWVTDEHAMAPAWLQEVRTPALKRTDPNGAIGRLLMCLLNTQNLRDPLSSDLIRLGSTDGEDHHIFPKKFADKLAGWDGKLHHTNTALNLMRLSKSTNARFSDDDPALQVRESFSSLDESTARKIYADQFIPENALAILLKEHKTVGDYLDFLAIRENAFKNHILQNFGFGPDSDLAQTDEDLEQDDEEDAED